MKRFLSVLIGTMAASSGIVSAQSPSRSVDVANLTPDAAAVFNLWTRYLTSKGGAFSANAWVPSPDWLDAEQRRWPVYDLASAYQADGAIPTVVSIDKVDGTMSPEYRITTRFRFGEQSERPLSWWSATTVTTYAVRDGDHWRLANALPRNTRAWRRETVGPITYVFAPDYPYDAARARQAVAFTDSVAVMFGLPRLDSLSYYLTTSLDEMYGIMGIESDLKYGPGPNAGLAQPRNRQLFSGSTAIGEEYQHELAHLILAPLCCTRTSFFVSEGIPTWLGGTSGMDFPTATRVLSTFLSEHPTVSLDSILSKSIPNVEFYAAGAVLTAMVFEQGGVAAVKALFDTGSTPAELRAAVERQLGRSWATIVSQWRRRVDDIAGAHTGRDAVNSRTGAPARTSTSTARSPGGAGHPLLERRITGK